MRRQSEVQQAARDRSWVESVDQLRSAPDQLRQLLPPGPDFVDVRLHRLWVLLRGTVGRDARFAIDSVAGLEPMLGSEISESVRDGLVRHWRAWRPLLKDAMEPAKRNHIRPLDCMGITGVTLEAKGSDRWAARLTSDEAALAASYAILEINGFPWWLSDLAKSKPVEVHAVLMKEIGAELANPQPSPHCDLLEDISNADGNLIELLTPALLVELEGRPDLPYLVLVAMLKVITRGIRAEPSGIHCTCNQSVQNHR